MAVNRPHRYALVGHPVQHSRSPLIHQLFARQTGQELSYELIDAEPASFETAVRGFGAAGGRGLNITVPHKQAAFELANELGEDARRAKAVNTVSFMANGQLRGDNTDGVGFMRDLTRNLGESVAERRIVILGAGGAARGLVGPLLDAEPGALILANRTLARARALVEEFDDPVLAACTFGELVDLEPFDVVINATSASLHGEEPPFAPQCIGAHSLCYDLAYSIKPTPFLEWAAARGARHAVQGWGMLIEQAAESFFIWRSVRPDTAPLLAQLPR